MGLAVTDDALSSPSQQATSPSGTGTGFEDLRGEPVNSAVARVHHPKPSRAMNTKGEVFVVASYQRGSGKSAASLMLASELARGLADTGKSVVVIDANFGQGSSIQRILRLEDEGFRAYTTLTEDELRTSGLRKVAHRSGRPGAAPVDMLLCPAEFTDMAYPDVRLFRRVLNTARSNYDYVVVDTPVGRAGDTKLDQDARFFTECFLRDATSLVLVVEQNHETVQNNQLWAMQITTPISIGGYGLDPSRVKILLNKHRSDQQSVSEDMVFRAFSYGGHSGTGGYPYLGRLPFSEEVQNAGNIGTLLDPLPKMREPLRAVLANLTGLATFRDVQSSKGRRKRSKTVADSGESFITWMEGGLRRFGSRFQAGDKR